LSNDSLRGLILGSFANPVPSWSRRSGVPCEAARNAFIDLPVGDSGVKPLYSHAVRECDVGPFCQACSVVHVLSGGSVSVSFSNPVPRVQPHAVRGSIAGRRAHPGLPCIRTMGGSAFCDAGLSGRVAWRLGVRFRVIHVETGGSMAGRFANPATMHTCAGWSCAGRSTHTASTCMLFWERMPLSTHRSADSMRGWCMQSDSKDAHTRQADGGLRDVRRGPHCQGSIQEATPYIVSYLAL
jgi:hypothetical protein